MWIAELNRGVTPVALDLDNHNPHTVVFKRDGYHDIVCEIGATVGAGWVVLDILGGLLPVIVDAATGAWKSLDKGACNMNMSPTLAPTGQTQQSHPTASKEGNLPLGTPSGPLPLPPSPVTFHA